MDLSFFAAFAEEKILRAQKEGGFDNLEGMGKPLNLAEDELIPDDCRMAYKILKNSGYVPPEVAERKEVCSIKEMLAACKDEQERYRQMQKLNLLKAKISMRRNGPIFLEDDSDYYEKIVERITLGKEDQSSMGK